MESCDVSQLDAVVLAPSRNLWAFVAHLADVFLNGEDGVARTNDSDALAGIGEYVHFDGARVQIGGKLHRDGAKAMACRRGRHCAPTFAGELP